jgi:hypothetical protein
MQEERRLLPADGRPIASLAEYAAAGGLVLFSAPVLSAAR